MCTEIEIVCADGDVVELCTPREMQAAGLPVREHLRLASYAPFGHDVDALMAWECGCPVDAPVMLAAAGIPFERGCGLVISEVDLRARCERTAPRLEVTRWAKA